MVKGTDSVHWTPQNEDELADAVKVLSQSAIETLVRDKNVSNKPQMELKSLRAQDHDRVLQHYLAPLCKEHHLIAHSINLKVHEKRSAVLF